VESSEARAAASELSAMAVTLNQLVSQFKYEEN
jgi:methyl-accepting chemotaxis protein